MIKARIIIGYKCKLCGTFGLPDEFDSVVNRDQDGLKDVDMFCKNPDCDGWNDDLTEIMESKPQIIGAGNQRDVKIRLFHASGKFSIEDLQKEILLERSWKNRKSVIKLLQREMRILEKCKPHRKF